jgi:DEAD/DEAH box helicase domain-containing protein
MLHRIKLNPSFWHQKPCIPFAEDIVPSSLFLRNRHYLVVDIETQRTFQEVGGEDRFDLLGVSVACAYDSQSDKFLTFRENELKKLFTLCEQRLIVGFNVKRFDLPVLASYGLELKGLDVFDLMTDLETLTRRRFISLESVARGCLGVGKLADGLQAIQWWKEGKIDSIIEYCLEDVKITRDVFEFGRHNHEIKIMRTVSGADTIQPVPVQWN